MNEALKNSDQFFSKLREDHSYRYWQDQALNGKTIQRQEIGYKRQYKRYWQILRQVESTQRSTS